MTPRTETLLDLARKHIIPHKPGVIRAPIMATGQGSIVGDTDGRSYIDFLSGQVCSTIGHSHPAVVEALRESCERMLHCNANMQSETGILLAAELAAIMPGRLSKSLFKSSGSEANEMAIHLAKKATGNWEVVSLAGAFHGMTSGPRASTFTSGTRGGYGPGVPGTFAFPVPDCYRSRHATRKATDDGWVCEESVRECLAMGTALFDAQSQGSPAAVLVEPILSAGGVTEPPVSFLRGLKTFAEERGMLLIMDECQTGLGRAGSWLVSHDYGFVPDVITLSKTLGAGLPVSSVTTTPEIVDILVEKRFMHSASHVNDPFAGAVGLAVLRVLKEEGLIEQSRRKGEAIKAALRRMAQRWEWIGDIRGRGLLLGMELVRDRDSKEPADAECRRFHDLCLESGLILNICGAYNNVIRMMPPITISDSEIDAALAIMDSAFRRMAEDAAAPAPRAASLAAH
ncbi:aspartate aminotransferase family protein [Roseomonas sp. OT10]|uniref:aspartate aminotransferase family protein n=1 Tax=Roseomonas cutis TaxID=2897332 RepID=UPI001E5F384E|nr:aspartate aminotransferase family protein [Roseomonas sp. OT10]UFN48510.1 aspartate aminotransferase family protein [Roseomonas sp. OT10]